MIGKTDVMVAWVWIEIPAPDYRGCAFQGRIEIVRHRDWRIVDRHKFNSIVTDFSLDVFSVTIPYLFITDFSLDLKSVNNPDVTVTDFSLDVFSVTIPYLFITDFSLDVFSVTKSDRLCATNPDSLRVTDTSELSY